MADQQVAVTEAPNSVTVTFEAATFFKLNTKPEVIRDFFNQVCLHHHCWDLSKGGGWEQMLDQFFRPVLENAARLGPAGGDHHGAGAVLGRRVTGPRRRPSAP
ncbi:MAG: hypothetical protein ABIS47_05885 [Acidimicrobiales bacterium]